MSETEDEKRPERVHGLRCMCDPCPFCVREAQAECPDWVCHDIDACAAYRAEDRA